MTIAKSIPKIRLLISEQRDQGKEIVLIPIKGNLHEGHTRLIEIAKDGHRSVSYTHLTLPTKRIV